jgi:aryl-alcohol dehydrogenase-like predicted oxidoreductase
VIKNILLGTVQFGLEYGINNHSGKPSEIRVFEILDTAWKNGIDTLDTADAYGNAMNLISDYHRVSGNVFKINTKFKNVDANGINNKIKSDLLLLQCAKINALFFHSYTEYKESGHNLFELQKAKEEGLISSIGVSIYTNEELLDVINDSKIDIIQLPYNLLDNDFQRGSLLKIAKEKGKKIQVRSVFLQGLFFIESKEVPEKLATLKPWIAKIETIAELLNITKESLCFLYPNAQAYIDEIIIGVDTKEQLLRNLESLKLSLPAAVKNEIDQISVNPSSILYPPNWL